MLLVHFLHVVLTAAAAAVGVVVICYDGRSDVVIANSTRTSTDEPDERDHDQARVGYG